MPIFERWTVVSVPFPYVERAVLKRRPAVVVSSYGLVAGHRLAWVLMITSADHPSWPDDIPIDDLPMAGLPRSSVARPVKIATVEAERCLELGRLSSRVAIMVDRMLARCLS